METEKNYKEASDEFEKILSFSDAKDHFCECQYLRGELLIREKKYVEAKSCFDNLKEYSYKDCNVRSIECQQLYDTQLLLQKVKTIATVAAEILLVGGIIAAIFGIGNWMEKLQKEEEEKARQEIADNINMVKVEAGRFDMEKTTWSDGNKIHVTLTKDYWIGKYEVTQIQYEAVMGNNPSEFKGDNRPVERVSWHDAKAFCDKLNELYRDKLPAGYRFDLPTEAQWEFAARGGNKSKGYKYSGSNDIAKVAWYWDNSGRYTHDVGQKQPNELGLYDMSGNVEEWCRDWSDSYSGYAVTDPTGPQKGSCRVERGGSWNYDAVYCRVEHRSDSNPGSRSNSYGFRLALVPID